MRRHSFVWLPDGTERAYRTIRKARAVCLDAGSGSLLQRLIRHVHGGWLMKEWDINAGKSIDRNLANRPARFARDNGRLILRAAHPVQATKEAKTDE